MRRGWHPLLMAGGLYTLLTGLLLARVLPVFDRAIPGGPIAAVDGWQNVWNLWWVRTALERGENPFVTQMLFYPSGVGLYLQTLNITNGLLTLPVQWLGGPIAAYNTAVLLGFVLSGLGMYLLAWHVLRHRALALLAGALFAFTPFHITKLMDGQLEWIALQWIPFYMLALVLTLERHTPWFAVSAGGLFAAVALTSWYCALFVAVWSALWVVLHLAALRHSNRLWRACRAVILVAGTGSLVLLPIVLPGLRAMGWGNVWHEWTGDHAADLLDWLLPSPWHPLWGAQAQAWNRQIRPPYIGAWVIGPGLTLLALAGLGTWVARRRLWPWALTALVAGLLALGPSLRVAGVDTGLPLPFALLRWLPGATLARRPNHFIVVALPGLILLAGAGLRWLLARGRQWLALAAVALLIAEYVAVPAPAIAWQSHPAIATLAGQSGAIIDLPIETEGTDTLRHQLVHGRPIIGGFVARAPDYPFLEHVPGLFDLWLAQQATLTQTDVARGLLRDTPDILDQLAAARQAFAFYDLQTVVLRRTKLTPSAEQRIIDVLHRLYPDLQPTYHDTTLCVYQLPPLAHPQPFLLLGSGWYDLEQDRTRRWRWMADQAELYLVNPHTTSQPVEIRLTLVSFDTPRPFQLSIDGRVWLTTQATPVQRTLKLHLTLPPGEHRLRLISRSSPSHEPTPRPISLSFTDLQLEPLAEAAPSSAR
ncbi:hypothetical protein [Kallotenue papyrolyticum]|uniref:hypothetical protein n=1 Tax=Kallotenue papyrolyticum TaxID=1325125 RepID=UPI00047854DB|nr:hypothetical protein [Kallotenue papyrolyticum]